MSWGFPSHRQPTMAELGNMAKRSALLLEKTGEELNPIEAKGSRSPIANSWWGAAWCANLERYADYANRIDRGKRYVRAGAVLDLKIDEGKVHSWVQGSRLEPYEVDITIDPLLKEEADRIAGACEHRIANLESLMEGRFPNELKELFSAKGGLFPSPKEIHFDCSCPDWAHMCKHVASALYGIGARFDDDPLLFFQLRGIDVNSLIGQVVENKVDSMLANADRASARIMQQEDWKDVLGL